MPLDFPANPVDGQIYGSFTWSESTGAWKSNPTYNPVTTHSAVAPSSPKPGDIWYNTNLGISFTYYDDGTSRQWVEMFSSAVPAVSEIMPAGTIVQTARATAPTGWLMSDGSAVSRTTYAVLFNAIGTAYGSGDGSTTFNVPNLQGRIPVGKNSGTFSSLGATGGAETHTLSVTEMPSHTHAISSPNNIINWVGTGGNIAHAAGSSLQGYTMSATATGGGGAHNNLQPYIVLNYMIKV